MQYHSYLHAHTRSMQTNFSVKNILRCKKWVDKGRWLRIQVRPVLQTTCIKNKYLFLESIYCFLNMLAHYMMSYSLTLAHATRGLHSPHQCRYFMICPWKWATCHISTLWEVSLRPTEMPAYGGVNIVLCRSVCNLVLSCCCLYDKKYVSCNVISIVWVSFSIEYNRCFVRKSLFTRVLRKKWKVSL